MFKRYIDWFEQLDDAEAICLMALRMTIAALVGCLGGWIVAMVL